MTITNGYISREELKDQIDDPSEMTGVRYDDVINATSRAIDELCNQFFYDAGTASAQTYRATQQDHLDVQPFSTLTGLIVKTDEGDLGTYGTTWTLTTDYTVPAEPGFPGRTEPFDRINAVGARWFPVTGWRERVQVTARWGWAAVPPEVKEACMIKAARLARRKDSPEGESGGYGVMGRTTWSPSEDKDVLALLNPFIRVTRNSSGMYVL